MCKVLKKLYRKTPEDILLEYGADDNIPVNLEKLAKNIGISVLPMDFTILEDKLGKKDILGLVMTDGDNAAIFYRETDSINRIRFTIAHELGHCCSFDPAIKIPHVEYRIDEDEKDIFEKEMDVFAGKLLIPIKQLREVYMSLEMPTSTILAKRFCVSIRVMEARLNYLKISYLNSKGEVVLYG